MRDWLEKNLPFGRPLTSRSRFTRDDVVHLSETYHREQMLTLLKGFTFCPYCGVKLSPSTDATLLTCRNKLCPSDVKITIRRSPK